MKLIMSFGALFLLGNVATSQETKEKPTTGKAMEGVVVTARKPLIEIKADKTILNVAGSINASGKDTLEILKTAPGVNVDKDDNISLSGKNGILVYIDGKPSPLTGQDLSNYLRALPSSQIESIEIITNPSAKYDAAGNAGIINIKLKKNTAFGNNGSINAMIGFGRRLKLNGSLSVNHRDKKINAYGTYSHTDFKSKSSPTTHRSQQTIWTSFPAALLHTPGIKIISGACRLVPG